MYKSIIITVLFFIIFCHCRIYDQDNTQSVCRNTTDKKQTLKLLAEQDIADSFDNESVDDEEEENKATIPTHFEASGVELRPDGLVVYVIFDNTYQIGAFCTSSADESTSCTDQLLEWPDETMRDEISEFEGIAYNPLNGTYFIIQETIPIGLNSSKLGSNVFEIRIMSDDANPSIQLLESCQVEWEFESKSKGFEGLEFMVHRTTGKTYLLALCEANNCSMATIQDEAPYNLGNGHIVVLEKQAARGNIPCLWKSVGIINFPLDARFRDYSALSVYRQKMPNYVAVTSQENSQLWIGIIEEINQAPYFKLKSARKNSIYNFPRTIPDGNDCPIVYCNVEGVTWQNRNQLIFVSDEAKSRHAPICANKDQMIHYFSLPRNRFD